MGPVERAVKAIAALVGTTGLGVLLWAIMTPSETQMKERSKEFPLCSPQQLAERRSRNAQVMALIKEAAETNENVAQRPWPWIK